MSRGDQTKLERWVHDQTGLTWWGLDFETKTKLRSAYHESLSRIEPEGAEDWDVSAWAYAVYGAEFSRCTPAQQENWRRLHAEVNP